MLRTWIGALALAVLWGAPAGATDDPKVRRAVLKPLKQAERAGFERHQVKRYLSVFTKDAQWTFGRRPVADAHDRVYDRAARRSDLKRTWGEPSNGRNHMFFREESLAVTGETATYEVLVRQDYFGGNREVGRRYELVKQGRHWKVRRVREWPRQERLGIEHTVFDDAYWLDADAAIENRPAPAGIPRLMQFMRAYRYQEALAEIRTRTDSGAADLTTQAWLARATVAIELGHTDEALAAVRKARALDPMVEAPVKLRKEFPSKHHRRAR